MTAHELVDLLVWCLIVHVMFLVVVGVNPLDELDDWFEKRRSRRRRGRR